MKPSAPSRPTYTPALITAWLDHLGWKPAQLARAVGLSAMQIGRLARGERPYTQPNIEVIAKALGVTVVELLAVDPNDPQSRLRVAAEIAKIPPERYAEALSYLAYLAEKRITPDPK